MTVITVGSSSPVVVTAPEGIRGRQGPAGPPGGNFVYTSSGAPAASHVIDHNMGFHPNVQVFDQVTGSLVHTQPIHHSVNQLELQTNAAMSIIAYLS